MLAQDLSVIVRLDSDHNNNGVQRIRRIHTFQSRHVYYVGYSGRA